MRPGCRRARAARPRRSVSDGRAAERRPAAVGSGAARISGARFVRRRLAEELRTAPVTYAYLAIVSATTVALATVGARLANRILLAQSTNLHHLAHDPVRVLVSSPLWLAGPSAAAAAAVGLPLVLAPAERRLGSRRTIEIFALGHVGATLVTAAGLWVALRLDAVEREVVNARDVGASYGLIAVATASTATLAPQLRRRITTLFIAVLAAVLLISPEFTNAGHVVAALIGLGCRRIVARATSADGSKGKAYRKADPS